MLCSITDASELLGYRSRAQLYRMKEDHWLDDYIQMIDGKTYFHMEGPRGKPSLARHIIGIIDCYNLTFKNISLHGMQGAAV